MPIKNHIKKYNIAKKRNMNMKMSNMLSQNNIKRIIIRKNNMLQREKKNIKSRKINNMNKNMILN